MQTCIADKGFSLAFLVCTIPCISTSQGSSPQALEPLSYILLRPQHIVFFTPFLHVCSGVHRASDDSVYVCANVKRKRPVYWHTGMLRTGVLVYLLLGAGMSVTQRTLKKRKKSRIELELELVRKRRSLNPKPILIQSSVAEWRTCTQATLAPALPLSLLSPLTKKDACRFLTILDIFI